MLLNHLKIAFRTTAKHRGYSFINLFGLAVGIACFAIIMLYIYDELSYDQFHADADRIYRVVVDRVLPDGSKTPTAWTETALISAMLQDIPEIEKGTRICRNPAWGKASLAHSEDMYYDDKGLYVDSTFFDVFPFSFVQGNAKSAFTNPSSIILTQSLAEKFFGNENAIGKTMIFKHYYFKDKALQVSGVIEDVPSQSHFTFDFLIPIYSTLSTVPWWKEGTWATDNTISSYFKVTPGVSMEEVRAKIQKLVEANRPQNADIYSIQPLNGLNGIHLSSHRSGELGTNSDKLYIEVLFIVALFVVLIAGINYVNLATARSAMRAKEIGVRKVVGALRKSLIWQFVSESVLMSMSAGLIAIGLTEAALPFFNAIMQRQLSLFAQASQPIWLLIAAAIFAIGLVAGLYPAFYLSSFRPASVLKDLKVSASTGFGLRQGLVVFQFGLATLLMVGVIIVQKQMNFVQDADLGFDKDQVIVIKNFSNPDPNFVIRRALTQLPGVINVGATGQVVGLMDHSWMTPVNVRGSDNKQPLMWGAYIDHNYLDVLGIELKEGRNFSPERDKGPRGLGNTVILNQTAIRLLKVSEPIIGQQIVTAWGHVYTIVGVAKDFHATSLHDEIAPIAFVFTHLAERFVAIKMAGGNIRQTLSQIEETWAGFVPDLPLDFYFLDSAVEQQYRSEQNFRVIFSIMTGLSLVIACLGLFGLAAFTAEQRTKEIGIRKVVGASTVNLVTMLSRDFVKLVLVASFIAWPVAYFSMNKWLQNFAYHIDIGWWTFALAGGLALLIALLTVSTQAIRAALANPAESLKYE